MQFKRSIFHSSGCLGLYVAVIWTAVIVVLIGRWFDKPCLCVNESQHKPSEKLQLQTVPSPVFRELQIGRWDSRRQYQLFDNVVVGEKFLNLSKSSLVTLASHADPEHFFYIFEQREHWEGPISLALFAGGDEERLVLETQLQFFRRCHAESASTMSIHLAVPITTRKGKWDLSYLEKLLRKLEHDLDCELQAEAFQKLVDVWKPKKTKKPRESLKYPQNHMRNLARKNSQTSFVFLVDVDILASLNLRQRLEEFLRKESDGGRTLSEMSKRKIAYVLPTYEVRKTASFPKSKEEMVQLAKQGLAQPFHRKVWKPNQWYTNFSRWQREEDTGEEIRVAYNVTEKIRLGYEPFYIALDNAPPHDERFVGYGYTRNTQVYEMVAAGYTFSVLSPAFTIHWGFHEKSFHPYWRRIQIYKNSRKHKVFKAEVAARYGIQTQQAQTPETNKAQGPQPEIQQASQPNENNEPAKQNTEPETDTPEPESETLKPETKTLNKPETENFNKPEAKSVSPEIRIFEPQMGLFDPRL